MNCLTSINYNLEENIYITTNVSLIEARAVLSVEKSQKKAWLVVFNSSKAKYNYLVHEQEMLAIIYTLKKQYFHLLRTRFSVYTNYYILKYFQNQKELSCYQICWADFMLQYNFNIKYIKGTNNIVADFLSQYLYNLSSTRTKIPAIREKTPKIVAIILKLKTKKSIVQKILKGY